jgi:hypothetical protein
VSGRVGVGGWGQRDGQPDLTLLLLGSLGAHSSTSGLKRASRGPWERVQPLPLALPAQPSCPCESPAQARVWVVLQTHPRQWKQNTKTHILTSVGYQRHCLLQRALLPENITSSAARCLLPQGAAEGSVDRSKLASAL